MLSHIFEGRPFTRCGTNVQKDGFIDCLEANLEKVLSDAEGSWSVRPKACCLKQSLKSLEYMLCDSSGIQKLVKSREMRMNMNIQSANECTQWIDICEEGLPCTQICRLENKELEWFWSLALQIRESML